VGVLRFTAKHFCAECNHPLTWAEKMNSHGVCPYCGTVSGFTVVRTQTRAEPLSSGTGYYLDRKQKFKYVKIVLCDNCAKELPEAEQKVVRLVQERVISWLPWPTRWVRE